MSITNLFSCVSCCADAQPPQQQNPHQPAAPIQAAQGAIRGAYNHPTIPFARVTEEERQNYHDSLNLPNSAPEAWQNQGPSPFPKKAEWGSKEEKRNGEPLAAPDKTSVKKSGVVAPAIAEIYGTLNPEPLSHVIELDEKKFEADVKELEDFLFGTLMPIFDRDVELEKERERLSELWQKVPDESAEKAELKNQLDALEEPMHQSARDVKKAKATASQLGMQLFRELTKTIPSYFDLPNQGAKWGLADDAEPLVAPYPDTFRDFGDMNPGFPREAVRYDLDMTKNQIRNYNKYCRELDLFILKNKASLLRDFSGIEDPAVVERMEYTIKRMSDEPHVGCAFVGLVTFKDPKGSPSPSCLSCEKAPKPVVIKPRSGAPEKHIMDLFDRINHLYRCQKSYKQKLETFKVEDYPSKSVHEFSAHEFVEGVMLKKFQADSATQHLDMLLHENSPGYPNALESALHLEQVSKEALASDLHGENVLFHLCKYIGIDWEVMTNTAVPPFKSTFIFHENRRDANGQIIPDSEDFYKKQVKPLKTAERDLIHEANKKLFDMELRAVPVATAVLQNWIHQFDIKAKVEEFLCQKLIKDGWDLTESSDTIVKLMERVARQGDIAYFSCIGNDLYIKMYEDGKITNIPIARINNGVKQ